MVGEAADRLAEPVDVTAMHGGLCGLLAHHEEMDALLQTGAPSPRAESRSACTTSIQ